MDHYTDRRHPYATMSPSATMHKILRALPDGVENCRVIGMPSIDNEDELAKMYTGHVEAWKMSIQWAVEFEKLSQAIQAVRPSERRYIPALNLPPVPGMPFRSREGEIYYSLTGDPPLSFLWKPMLTLDPKMAFDEFIVGKLPVLVQGTLMAWIFDGDVHEFLGDDHEPMSEVRVVSPAFLETRTLTRGLSWQDKIFDKYYRNHNTALDDFMRSGCLSHWRESVMQNVEKMLSRYIMQVELAGDVQMLRELGDNEDFNDDDAYARDVRRGAFGEGASEEEGEEEEEDDEERDDGGWETRERYIDDAAEGDGDEQEGEEGEAVQSPEGEHEGHPEEEPGQEKTGEEEGEEGEEDDERAMERAFRRAVTKLRSYMLTAWQWHCSMITGGAYESEVIEESNAIIASHASTICEDARAFDRRFIETPLKEKRVLIEGRMCAPLAGCLSFQGAVMFINTVANMNAANLTTFREIFTTSIGIYLGSSNSTWACFYWPIQVAVGFGNFVLSTKEGNVPYWVKPNSSGMDSVLVPTVLKCRKLFQVKMRCTEARAQAMIQLSRATPKAIEDIGRLVFDQGRVVQRPNKAMRMQLILMTEQRKMVDTILNTLINALPRHDNANDTNNMVLSTDVSAQAGGARRGTEAVRIDTAKIVLCGTNVPADRFAEGECLQTMRSTMVMMPPGGQVDAGQVNRKRKISEIHHDASKSDCMFFTKDEDRATLCPGMCIAPLLATSLAVMNDFGLVRIEISEMVNDLYAWYYWMVDTHFKWTVAAAMSGSIQRLLYGWKARGVADTLLYRVIGELGRADTMDSAIVQTLFASAFEAHSMFLVPTQVHQNLRGIIDGQSLLVSRFVVSTMRIPVVPFSWLVAVLMGRKNVDIQNDKYARNVHNWLTAMGHGRNFLPRDGRHDLDFGDNVTPYVSTSATASGAPLGDGPTLMRFPSTGYSVIAQAASRFISSPQANVAYHSMGVPKDVNVYKNAIQAYASMTVEVSTFFNSFDIFDVPRFFDLFEVTPRPLPCVYGAVF